MTGNLPGEDKESQFFQLKPFMQSDPPLDIQIKGEVKRLGRVLVIGYEITGDLFPVHFPSLSRSPERKSYLWEDTCLEFFISPKDSSRYWEFNLSPSGDWNVFRFEDYRNQGHGGRMRQEDAFEFFPFRVRMDPRSFCLDLECHPDKIISELQDADMSVCAILRTKTKNMSFWALAHGGMKPDFHQRGDFILKL